MKIFRFLLAFVITTSMSMAGLEKAQDLMKTVSDALTALSLATVTVAILWVGYKVLFTGAALRDMGSTILGAVIIASAAQIASMLV
jgi:type IV secretion system protein VirB2